MPSDAPVNRFRITLRSLGPARNTPSRWRATSRSTRHQPRWRALPGGARRGGRHALPGRPELVLEVAVRDLRVDYPGSDTPAITGITFTFHPAGPLPSSAPRGAASPRLQMPSLGLCSPRGVLSRSADWLRAGRSSLSRLGRLRSQSVALVSGSVRDNVALGRTRDEIDDDRVWAALKRAHLADYLADGRDGLDTQVGERGVQLSGGQRQRLGIARALYTEPRLLVMDEATSALDAEIENLVAQTIEELGSEVTTITIAHRPRLPSVARAHWSSTWTAAACCHRGPLRKYESRCRDSIAKRTCWGCECRWPREGLSGVALDAFTPGRWPESA